MTTTAARLSAAVLNVPARVISPAGRARVPQRKTELEHFLESLRGETQDLKNL
jgi:hypothetical protein